MSGEHGEITIPMDLDLKWTKEILIEQNKHLAKLLEENSKLREDLREGISLRDHFAGLAMQGFLALNKFKTALVVDMAYVMADAMLAERDKRDG
jgi:hypothetical protein